MGGLRFFYKKMCEARMIEKRFHILFFHDAAGKESEHLLRNDKAVIAAVFLFYGFMGNHPVNKQTIARMNLNLFLINPGLNHTLKYPDKLHFLMPVKYPEPFIGRRAYLPCHVKNQERKGPAFKGVMGVNGRPAVLRLRISTGIFLMALTAGGL